MIAAGSLDRVALQAGRLRGIRRSDAHAGDWILVKTRNSSYRILCLGDDHYCVLGGWFDLRGVAPATVTIRGCTWGGSAIHTDLLAAPGLFLEFGNDVVTTRIREVRLQRSVEAYQLH